MTEQARLRALLLLSIELRRLDGHGTVPSRLCVAGCRVLGGDGAALAIDRQGLEHLVLHATDELATDLDQLQEVAGDGPSHDAVAHGRVAAGAHRRGTSGGLRSPTSSRCWPTTATCSRCRCSRPTSWSAS